MLKEAGVMGEMAAMIKKREEERRRKML